jgi:hypothetical protein
MSSKHSLYQGVIEGNGTQDQEAIAAGEMKNIAKRKDRQLKTRARQAKPAYGK